MSLGVTDFSQEAPVGPKICFPAQEYCPGKSKLPKWELDHACGSFDGAMLTKYLEGPRYVGGSWMGSDGCVARVGGEVSGEVLGCGKNWWLLVRRGRLPMVRN